MEMFEPGRPHIRMPAAALASEHVDVHYIIQEEEGAIYMMGIPLYLISAHHNHPNYGIGAPGAVASK